MVLVTNKGPLSSVWDVWQYRMKRLPKYYLKRLTMNRELLERIYERKLGRKPNFDAPRAFTEKMGWLKLHYHNPLYTQLADKVAVREYVRSRVGDDLLLQQYGTWGAVEEIPFDTLPETFVLKCNHESGFVIFCKDKSTLDRRLARMLLKTRLNMNFYYWFLEWPYRDIQPCILAEQLLMERDGAEPMEYKFFCFGGQPRFILAEQFSPNRYLRCLYLPSWEPMPFAIRIPNTPDAMPRPANLARMLDIAAALSRDLMFCRVDLFSAGDQLYFNEMTLLPSAGMGNFIPDSYDFYWGEQLQLPDTASGML
ncbi:MAG: ATP-grasp fold amidoligase family protein [Armatimonadota bacterium]